MQEVVVRGEPFCMLALSPEGNAFAVSVDSHLRRNDGPSVVCDSHRESAISRPPSGRKLSERILATIRFPIILHLADLFDSKSRDSQYCLQVSSIVAASNYAKLY
jgi:hypothetical protein